MSTNSISRIGRFRLGWWLAAALVILFVYGLATGLSTAIRLLSPSHLIPLGLCAIALGWVLAGARNKTIFFFSLGIITGALIIIAFQSGISRNLYRAFSATLNIQFVPKPLRFDHPNPMVILSHHFQTLQNLNTYFLALAEWFRNLIDQRRAVSLEAINLIWGSILWGSLYAMGWLLRYKKHAFMACLPALLLLGGVIGFTRRESSGLIVAISAVLALMVLMELLLREQRWEENAVDYSEEIRFDIFSGAIPLLAVIITCAGLIPRFTQVNLRTLFNIQRRDDSQSQVDISTSLGLELEPLESITRATTPGLPRSHLIGSGNELSDVIIMEIDLGRYYVPPQIDPLTQLPKYYWFGRAYDVYTGTGWTTSDIRQESIPANQVLDSEALPFYVSTQQVIRKTNHASATLYFSGILTSVDQNITVDRHATTDEFLSAQLRGLDYQVTTFVMGVPEEQLRQSESDPPESIQSIYLQLPPELPERVVKLAGEITQQAGSHYEQAKMIEAYLRQFEYTLDLPTPPVDQDVVDYFLFELQKGYCDYFASAMVILARAAGLPARLVVGYAPADYDYNRQVFVVVEANAHAWPEIFIDPFGWVPFEPTASLSPIDRATVNESQPPAFSTDPDETHLITQQVEWQDQLVWIILILMSILLAIGLSLYHVRRKKQQSTTAQIETIYQATRTHLARVFFKPGTEHTPHELFLTYADFLQPSKYRRYLHRIANRTLANLQSLIQLYEMGVYAPQVLLTSQVKEARQNLISLWIQSWLLRMARITRSS